MVIEPLPVMEGIFTSVPISVIIVGGMLNARFTTVLARVRKVPLPAMTVPGSKIKAPAARPMAWLKIAEAAMLIVPVLLKGITFDPDLEKVPAFTLITPEFVKGTLPVPVVPALVLVIVPVLLNAFTDK